MQLYRLARRAYVEGSGGAFSGEGAYLAGSRWNSPGHRVAFAASSESLAILEYLVHATNEAYFEDVVLVIAELAERFVMTIDATQLPNDWRDFPPSASTVRVGNEWLVSGRSLALSVPSAVVPREPNVLINSAHRDMRHLRILALEPWLPDLRLKKR